MRVLCITIALLLAACGASPSAAQRVFDQLQRAGLAAHARVMRPAEAGSPIARCGERLQFDIPDAPADAFGVIMICPKEPRLNISPVGGALVYRSAGGTVNVLVSGAPEAAPRIEHEIEHIKE